MPLPPYPPSGGKTLIVLYSLMDVSASLRMNERIVWCSIGKIYADPMRYLRPVEQAVICTSSLNEERVPELVAHICEYRVFLKKRIYLEESLKDILVWADFNSQLATMERLLLQHASEIPTPPLIHVVAQKWFQTRKNRKALLEGVREYYPNADQGNVDSAKQQLRKKGWSLDGQPPVIEAQTLLEEFLESMYLPGGKQVTVFFEELAVKSKAIAGLSRKLEGNSNQIAMLRAAIKSK